jgi:methyl-accepting chemotaxis protein
MASALVQEGRRGNGAGSEHSGRERTNMAARRSGEELMPVLDEVNRVAMAVREGKLGERARATLFNGIEREVVQGVNEILDAVSAPLNLAMDTASRLGRGEIPPRITSSYSGDFDTLKCSLNSSIDAVNALVADAGMLARAAVEGKLATRADADKHQGDYRKIVEGVNQTLDAVIGPLNVAASYVDQIAKGAIPAKITDTYNGDFNVIKNNLNTCIDAVNARRRWRISSTPVPM